MVPYPWVLHFCLLNKNCYRRFRHANENTDLEKGKEKKGAGSNNPYYSRCHKIEASGAILLGPLSRQSFLTLPRWSGDVIRRTGVKNFNAVSHNRARPYFRIQHGRGEVRARRVYLNVHSVTGNVVDTEWSVEFWRWKYCREFWNNTYGRVRLWDTALKFFFPVLQITSPDHLDYCLYAMGTITFRKNEPSSLFSGITSFAGSNQMIFISMLTCTIWSQGGPNKMAVANFLWLHIQNKRLDPVIFFFGDQWMKLMAHFALHWAITLVCMHR